MTAARCWNRGQPIKNTLGADRVGLFTISPVNVTFEWSVVLKGGLCGVLPLSRYRGVCKYNTKELFCFLDFWLNRYYYSLKNILFCTVASHKKQFFSVKMLKTISVSQEVGSDGLGCVNWQSWPSSLSLPSSSDTCYCDLDRARWTPPPRFKRCINAARACPQQCLKAFGAQTWRD